MDKKILEELKFYYNNIVLSSEYTHEKMRTLEIFIKYKYNKLAISTLEAIDIHEDCEYDNTTSTIVSYIINHENNEMFDYIIKKRNVSCNSKFLIKKIIENGSRYMMDYVSNYHKDIVDLLISDTSFLFSVIPHIESIDKLLLFKNKIRKMETECLKNILYDSVYNTNTEIIKYLIDEFKKRNITISDKKEFFIEFITRSFYLNWSILEMVSKELGVNFNNTNNDHQTVSDLIGTDMFSDKAVDLIRKNIIFNPILEKKLHMDLINYADLETSDYINIVKHAISKMNKNPYIYIQSIYDFIVKLHNEKFINKNQYESLLKAWCKKI